MSKVDPDATPIIDLSSREGTASAAAAGLADRWQRLNAALIDGIIALCYGLPILYLVGFWNESGTERQRPLVLEFAPAVVGLAGFLLIHGHLLKKNGQTVGKYLMDIRIADLRGNVPDFRKVILLRYLPISSAELIPVLGGFVVVVDALFIFRRDRRCLHDLFAGTKVVKIRMPP